MLALDAMKMVIICRFSFHCISLPTGLLAMHHRSKKTQANNVVSPV